MAEQGDNLESQLDALMAEMAADPPPSAASAGDALIDDVVDQALDAGEAAMRAAVDEAATGDAGQTAAASDASEATAAETVVPATAEETSTPAEQAVEQASDLAAQLDAMLQSDAPAEAVSTAETPETGASEAADSSTATALAESEPPRVDPAASEIQADFEAGAEQANDLAAQLDAMLQESSTDVADEADDELDGEFVPEAEISGRADAAPPVDPVPDSEVIEDAGATAAVPEPAASPQTTGPDDENEAEFDGDFATAAQVVDQSTAPEATDDDDAEADEFASEAELVSRVDDAIEAQAKEQIAAETEDEPDLGGLADLLGVDPAELAAVPSSDTGQATEAAPETTDAGDAIDFDGAFESVEDLLAETTEVSTETPGDFDEGDGGELGDDAFASVGNLLAEEDEEESWYEPPPDAEASGEAPDFTKRPGDDKKQRLTVSPTPRASGDEPTDEETAASERPQNASARKWWAPHIDRAKKASVRLRPYLARTPHATVCLVKAGCYYSHKPVEFAATKLAKDDRPAPPLKTYVGLVGAAVLLPGLVLVLFGLAT